MLLVILACGIVFLFVAMIVLKLNGFLALILASFFVGICSGMPATKILSSIQTGMGGTMGYLAIIIGFGAILGKLVAEAGGAQRIATTLVNKFGRKRVGWAMCLTSFVLGITMFWEVSFVILIPVVYSVAVAAEVPLLELALPMLAAIGVAHGYLPPHPGPTAVAGILGANLGLTMIYGIIIAIPAVIIGGPLYGKLFRNTKIEIPTHLITNKMFEESELPGFGVSVLVALSPVILIFIGVLGGFMLPKGSAILSLITFLGTPSVALFIALFLALYLFGLQGKRKSMTELMKSVSSSITSIGGIMFIIGGGGAFKQVILDSGMAKYVASLTSHWHMSALVLAFIITCVIRLAVGSATVAVLTASAIVLPIISGTGVSPELATLVVGAGSLFGGPPHDAGFWMTKEFFNLNMIQTIEVYCGMATIVSIVGFIGVLLLNLVV